MRRHVSRRWLILSFLISVVLLLSCVPSNLATPNQSPSTSDNNAAGRLNVASHLNIAVGPGHISDLWSLGNYAYLGAFREPRCSPEFTGIYIVDISDPANPVQAGFFPSPPGSMVSDVQAAHISTPGFTGDILVYSKEPCTGETRSDDTVGIAIYDVTNPLDPRPLTERFMGFPVHSTFIHQAGNRALLLVVSDERFEGTAERDVYIVDISQPSSPVVLSVMGLPDWGIGPQTQGGTPIAGFHDGWMQTYPVNNPNPAYAGKTIAYLAYWDAGLVILDITDPIHPVFLGDSEYPDPDRLTGFPPEGNSHTVVPTADGSLVLMGDEDFQPRRMIFSVDSGNFTGTYGAIALAFTKPIVDLEGQELKGPTTYIGGSCDDAVPAPTGILAPGEQFIALIERTGCLIDARIAAAAGAGYGGAIVFNNVESAPRLARISGDPAMGIIPALFVNRFTGFAMLGIDPDSPADTPLPPAGTAGQRVSARSAFDGWGYARILDVKDPKNIIELGRFATENVMKQPVPPGDRSMHNAEVDGRRAYISWYADGIVVIDFSDPANPREIARFVDEDNGSNFWGVRLHRTPGGKAYILGSDRDSGLWIFDVP